MKIINPYEPPQSSEPLPGIRHCFVEWLRGLLRREGWCSFCRKNYRQAGPLVEGVNRVYICHACSVAEHKHHRSALPAPGKASANTAMKKHAAPIIAAILLLLPVLYVGSYWVLVEPAGIQVSLGKPTLTKQVHYRIGTHLWAETFYWPLERIDRQVRPRAWDELQQLEKALQSYRHGGNLPEFSK
jgi:hypothetical protein